MASSRFSRHGVFSGCKYRTKYRYDQIGNRTRSDLGKWDRQFIYTANNVNQYTSRTVPDEFPVFGTALAAATVTVNSDTADRHDAYYSSVVLATNSSAAQYKKVTVEAIYNPPGTNNDYYMTSTGRVFVAKTPEVFTYDADGNMTSDGRFNYEWNAENRLVKVTTPLVGLPSNVPKVKLKMDYDQQGRRISQVRSTYDGSSWAWQETRSFIYDGWNLVGERRGTASGTTTNWYVWGLDMSGTIQGAGGVGGLLYANFNGVSHNYYAFDGNGNVSEVVGANGAVRAHYEYDPFGSSTTESGTLADENLFRFSTKYWDADIKLLYYGLRYDSPNLGRWLSRDPIGEKGGVNAYVFVLNSPPLRCDILGQYDVSTEPCFMDNLGAAVDSAGAAFPGGKDRITVDVLYCIAKKESGGKFHPCELGKDDDRGLFQLTPPARNTCRKYGVKIDQDARDLKDRNVCCSKRCQPQLCKKKVDSGYEYRKKCCPNCEDSVWNIDAAAKCAAYNFVDIIKSTEKKVSVENMICAYNHGAAYCDKLSNSELRADDYVKDVMDCISVRTPKPAHNPQ
jgi:RHS repeat-associated protein